MAGLMPGGFPGKLAVDLLSVLCNNEKTNGRTETTMIQTATETTANFTCPDCRQSFEVHGWMRVVVPGGPLLFVSAPGLSPRCPDDVFILLAIDEEGIKYGGPLT